MTSEEAAQWLVEYGQTISPRTHLQVWASIATRHATWLNTLHCSAAADMAVVDMHLRGCVLPLLPAWKEVGRDKK